MTELSPRTNTELFGHDEAEASLIRDFAAGKLAHGIIIAGPRGIGKATLAYRFARLLLSLPPGGGGWRKAPGEGALSAHEYVDSSPSPQPSPTRGEGVERRIAANSHSDLLVIEPAYDEKKEEYAREISVEQAREVAQFLALTPGEGAWRVVIIDTADQLNQNAANAILKILEEPPPQSVILLISNNIGKLLLTIRSRCRVLRLAPLSENDFEYAMRHVAPGTENLTTLAQLSDHSPGVALELGQGGIELYTELLGLLSPLPAIDATKIHVFADGIGTGQVHANWRVFMRLMLCFLERVARVSAGAEVHPVSAEEKQLLRKLSALHPAHVWAAKWQQAANQFSLAEARHLDYKQVVIAFIHSIAERQTGTIAA